MRAEVSEWDSTCVQKLVQGILFTTQEDIFGCRIPCEVIFWGQDQGLMVLAQGNERVNELANSGELQSECESYWIIFSKVMWSGSGDTHQLDSPMLTDEFDIASRISSRSFSHIDRLCNNLSSPNPILCFNLSASLKLNGQGTSTRELVPGCKEISFRILSRVLCQPLYEMTGNQDAGGTQLNYHHRFKM